MNDNELSQLMKDVPVASDDVRDEHIESALQHFPSTSLLSSPSRRSSRTTLWSVAAAALLVVGAGIGVSIQNLTDNNNEMYADANIGALGAVSADASTDTNDTAANGGTNDNVTKGNAPIGPCDNQYSDAQFIAVVLIGTERVAVYATGASSEPVVQLVDPQSCDELAISRR